MSGTVLLFGKLKDAFGVGGIPLPDGVATVADLRARLADAYPELAQMIASRSIRVAVNQELVADETSARISPADEIALMPPLSGG